MRSKPAKVVAKAELEAGNKPSDKTRYAVSIVETSRGRVQLSAL